MVLLYAVSGINKDNATILHYLLLPLLIVSAYKTSITDPGYNNNVQPNNKTYGKLCRHCETNKPPRCHHCKKCKQCVLRMDHHSSLLNNCIGKHNYKFFILTIFILGNVFSHSKALFKLSYSISLTQIIWNESLGYYQYYLTIISLIIGIIFGFLIVAFLGFHALYHIFLIIRLIINNKTTIEFMERKNENYDKGKWENIKEMLK